MIELVEIFDELKNDSSRTGKEAILKKYEDVKIFRDVLRFVYNPYIVTGISTKKLNKKLIQSKKDKLAKKVEEYDLHTPYSVNGILEYLTSYNSGRDVDIYIMQKCIDDIETKEEKDLIKKIITKSLKVGITAKTINKVYGKGEIPEFSVMLAESFDKKEDKVKGEFFITLKLDGNRCVIVNDEEDGVKFFTRSGKEIEGLTEIKEEIKKLPKGYVYDGEILLKNDKDLTSDKLFTETQKVIRKDGEKKDLEFYVFDAIPLKEFQEGKSKKTYKQRRNTLDLIFSNPSMSENNYVKLLTILYNGTDKDVIGVLMKWAEDNDYEGLMVNTADGLYQNKRTTDLLKIKKFKSDDLYCIAIEEGVGKNEGKLGAILVTYKGDSIVKVGSGFSDELREYYWKNPDEIINKVVEVKYFNESSNQDGGISLRFPVFKTIREDKGKDDVNIE